mmetsp:Transcript_18307/g.42157  ORF Transcript_18307/g.42157 Transcript_18307/m.42157 type:complete len:411 (-) Transcript_18307:672-1904(-)
MNVSDPEQSQSSEGALNGPSSRSEWLEEQGESSNGCYTDDDDYDDVEPTTFVQINGEIIATKRSIDGHAADANANANAFRHPFLSWLSAHAGILLMPILPLLWCALVVSVMDREMILSAWAMPFLGIASASLANAVPVGGGIVFVPALQLLVGVELKLGAAFAVATMTFGNGVFGFLSWLRKDPSSIAWGIVPFALLPAWFGATLATFSPVLSPRQCQRLFAVFCLVVASIVARSVLIHRRNPNRGGGKEFSIHASLDDDNGGRSSNDDDDDARRRRYSTRRRRQKVTASICSFLAGSILVAHIGIGNAMTTFLVASLVWKLPAKACVVTGIIVGGWTSALPFALHLLVVKDVPVALWVMGLPGVYLGARIAPLVHDRVGMPAVLTAFWVFLVGTAGLMLHHAAAAADGR